MLLSPEPQYELTWKRTLKLADGIKAASQLSIKQDTVLDHLGHLRTPSQGSLDVDRKSDCVRTQMEGQSYEPRIVGGVLKLEKARFSPGSSRRNSALGSPSPGRPIENI